MRERGRKKGKREGEALRCYIIQNDLSPSSSPSLLSLSRHPRDETLGATPPQNIRMRTFDNARSAEACHAK